MAVKNLRIQEQARDKSHKTTSMCTHTISLSSSQPRMVFTVKVPSVRGLGAPGERRRRCWEEKYQASSE